MSKRTGETRPRAFRFSVNAACRCRNDRRNGAGLNIPAAWPRRSWRRRTRKCFWSGGSSRTGDIPCPPISPSAPALRNRTRILRNETRRSAWPQDGMGQNKSQGRVLAAWFTRCILKLLVKTRGGRKAPASWTAAVLCLFVWRQSVRVVEKRQRTGAVQKLAPAGPHRQLGDAWQFTAGPVTTAALQDAQKERGRTFVRPLRD